MVHVLLCHGSFTLGLYSPGFLPDSLSPASDPSPGSALGQ